MPSPLEEKIIELYDRPYGFLIGGAWHGELWTPAGDLNVSKTNKRRVRCGECIAWIESGWAMRRKSLLRGWFVCNRCANRFILSFRDGYCCEIDVLGRLKIIEASLAEVEYGSRRYAVTDLADGFYRTANRERTKVSSL